MKETTVPVILRLWASVGALAICWFVAGVACGLRVWDIRVPFLFFIWSVPFFAAAWVLVGLPMIALGDRMLKVPILLMGVIGAVAGAFLMWLPSAPLALSLKANQHLVWDWDYWKGWPAFSAAIGACAMMLFRWFLCLAARRPAPS